MVKKAPRKMWKRMFIGKTDWQAVFPTYDLAKHEFGWIPLIRGNECPCQWRVDQENRIVIHGAYDERSKELIHPKGGSDHVDSK